jgi:hypothetical protein
MNNERDYIKKGGRLLRGVGMHAVTVVAMVGRERLLPIQDQNIWRGMYVFW